MKLDKDVQICFLLATVPPPLPVGFRLVGSSSMFSVSCDRTFYGGREAVRLFVVTLTAVTLAACAQSPFATNKSASLATSRQASLAHNRTASFVTNKRSAVVTKKHTPFATNKQSAGAPKASYGLASFYTEGSETASGEKLDGDKLTAAHRSLPFGTRVRVTNVANGRSVTVRINDRGPFIPGRVVDVSYSAAERLGIMERGITKVKLDVVH
jgi:peptidoglycan lytic transglycosylase